ncbi:MAG TPA: TetR/AcrR family transcriptional regulator [Aquihabitans sp.]|jgi:AcrR family transcriptional regulator|nr:TetR/AcrR family transcriptional regulator [Aquihabitans sp.]
MKTTRPYASDLRAQAAASTRQRIIEAASQLLREEWYEDVTLAGIAKAAGVSHQTVLNHFESKEGVARAVADVMGSATGRRRDRAVPGDVDGAIHVLVGEYEDYGDANVRWAVSADRLGSLAELLDGARATHQGWLEHIFGDALPTAGPARRRAVDALHAATDVYTWKLLRRDLRRSRPATERAMADLVRGVLAGHRSDGPTTTHPPTDHTTTTQPREGR